MENGWTQQQSGTVQEEQKKGRKNGMERKKGIRKRYTFRNIIKGQGITGWNMSTMKQNARGEDKYETS